MKKENINAGPSEAGAGSNLDNNNMYNTTYIINCINEALKDFTIENDINSLSEAPQNIYTASLMYAGARVFTPDFFIIDKQRNIYNVVLIDRLVNYYIYITKLYNKVSSIYDFTLFININYKSFLTWKNKNNNNLDIYNNVLINELYSIYDIDYNIYINKINYVVNNSVDLLNALQTAIFEKLHADRENALTTKLVTNNNAIGAVTAVNHEFSWNIQQLQQTQQIKALSVADLPKIETL